MAVRAGFFFSVLLLQSLVLSALGPSWVETYGADTPYPSGTYLTGFAMVNKNEPHSQEIAKEVALADLAGKIRTTVQSELIHIAKESTSGGDSSSVSLITRNSVNISIGRSDYLLYDDLKNSYALAYVLKSDLEDTYANEAASYWRIITDALSSHESLVGAKKTDLALKQLYNALNAFSNLYDRWTLIRAINGAESEQGFFRYLPGASNLADLRNAESEAAGLIEELTDRIDSSIYEAVRKIAVIMKIQGVTGGRIQVPPILFEATSFSSEFGRYASELLESELIESLPPGNGQTVFRSQYWEEEGLIRIIVFASSLAGEKFGRAEVLVPRTSVDSRSLHPQGYDDAMAALREFAEGALSDGGLNIDVWTNKGRDEDALVFTDGEIVQLYFRVNQPAFLQITYRLATGELVLLEKSFYIGSDRVNRTVPLPYELEVQPPFGIENLIVTAFSIEPPQGNTTPKTIDGELYEVFSTVKDVVAGSRGLGRSHNSGNELIRTGEAMLTMTMMER